MNTAKNVFGEKDISEVRTYWNNRPCNLRHSPLPVGSREYFDGVEARKYLVEPHIPLFAEFPPLEGQNRSGNRLRHGYRHHQFCPGRCAGYSC